MKELGRGLLGELGLKTCESSGARAASQALSASPFEMTSPHRQRDEGGCSAASPRLGALGWEQGRLDSLGQSRNPGFFWELAFLGVKEGGSEKP